LLPVEVSHVVSEFEVITDVGGLLCFHFAHNELSNVGGKIHEGNSTSTGTESEMLTVALNTEGLAHGALAHVLSIISESGTLKESLGETIDGHVCLKGHGEVLRVPKRVKFIIKTDFLASLVCLGMGVESGAHVCVLVLSHNVRDSVVADVADVFAIFSHFLEKEMLTSAADGVVASNLIRENGAGGRDELEGLDKLIL